MECWKGIQVVFTIVSFERADCDGVRVCTMYLLSLLLCVQRDSFKVECTILKTDENSSTMIIIFVDFSFPIVLVLVFLETRGCFQLLLQFPRDDWQARLSNVLQRFFSPWNCT